MKIHAAAKASELCAGLPDDRAKVGAIVDYVARSVLYDHLKARTVKRGYHPNPDATLETKHGICWDIASLVAAMLRSQAVQCRVVIGYADREYHAWNEVQLDSVWMRHDVTSMITGLRYKVYSAQRYQ